ncbi:MAG: hypothetical protein BWK78_01025 [Thiotrichaceae bacterium IS1]|nr:MAG: hypothetical protein BWK78_01025 [Thiotrichaceae bacterium IS1]
MTRATFIVGNKRSGSTHFMHLLNLHPNIFISNESDIIWILYRFHHDLEIIPYCWDTPVGMNRTLERFKGMLSKDKTPFQNFMDLQTAIMEEGVKGLPPMHKEQLLWIGDQKPFQQIDPELMPFIKANFPDAKYLHLIRHPFPVVRSSKVFKAGVLWKGMTEDEILKRWTMHETWVNQEGSKNVVSMLDVKYEDIVTDTAKTMARVFDFLGVNYEAALLKEARRITETLLKHHPRLTCPPETQAIMAQYGYTEQNFWLEQSRLVNSVNFFKRLRKKILGHW